MKTATKVETLPEGMLRVTRWCPFCQGECVIVVDANRYLRWWMGELAQSVFPEWSDAKRESLISGAHEHCFDTHASDA